MRSIQGTARQRGTRVFGKTKLSASRRSIVLLLSYKHCKVLTRPFLTCNADRRRIIGTPDAFGVKLDGHRSDYVIELMTNCHGSSRHASMDLYKAAQDCTHYYGYRTEIIQLCCWRESDWFRHRTSITPGATAYQCCLAHKCITHNHLFVE